MGSAAEWSRGVSFFRFDLREAYTVRGSGYRRVTAGVQSLPSCMGVGFVGNAVVMVGAWFSIKISGLAREKELDISSVRSLG